MMPTDMVLLDDVVLLATRSELAHGHSNVVRQSSLLDGVHHADHQSAEGHEGGAEPEDGLVTRLAVCMVVEMPANLRSRILGSGDQVRQ
jgi:hypothetical protein